MATSTETTSAASHIILGAGQWNNEPSNLAKQQEVLAVCRKYGIKTLDTARHYSHGESEAYLGNAGLAASGEFEIATKAPMLLSPNGAGKAGILKGWEESSRALKTEKVVMYLLHVPDDKTPIEETMEGIQFLYLAGHFNEFGLSNFSPSQVSTIHAHAKSKSYILPTIYQSLYSLCSRLNEIELFPLLRSLGIRIQAYSALGSGFLVKKPQDILAGKGNFDPSTTFGKILHSMYGRPSYIAFLEKYRVLCKELGEKEAGVAYRWVVWNSGLDVDGEGGDMVVVGASSARQLEETILEVGKGGLEGWAVGRLDEMWREVEADAPGDNFGTFRKLQEAGLL